MSDIVKVRITSLSSVKLVDKIEGKKYINFDVKARMEENERRSGFVRISFALDISTKPSIVKFSVEGTASIEGKDEVIKEMLEKDPDTQIPNVFNRVYKKIFVSMYCLASLLDAPSPPANLLYSNQQQMTTINMEDSQPMEAIPASETEDQQQQVPPIPATEQSEAQQVNTSPQVDTSTQTSNPEG